MVTLRTCKAAKQDGSPCGSPPLQDGALCYMHDPEHAADAAEARRLGGMRRKRESTLAGAYQVEALDNIAGIRRVLEIVTFDGLGMESNSVARGRLLIAAMQAATRLLETGELADQLRELRGVLEARLKPAKRLR